MAMFKPVKITKRGKTFQLTFYTPAGERRRISAGREEAYARRLAVKFDDWLMEGKDPEREMEKAKVSESAKSITVREFYPIFMKRHGVHKSKSMQEAYHYNFKNVCRCERIADAPLTDVTKSLVLDFMHARIDQDGVRPATVNRDATFLKGMLSRAVEWDIINHSPLNSLKMLPEANRRDVDLSVEQVTELIQTLPKSVDDIVEFAIYSGFRLENILGLTIEQITFHCHVMAAEVKTIVKGGRPEILKIGHLAVELLNRVIGNRKSGYVFVNPQTQTRYTTVQKTFSRTVQRLGITIDDGSYLRFHDLRHVFATWLHQNGVSLDTLRVLMGHKSIGITDRYVKTGDKASYAALSLMPSIRTATKEERSHGNATFELAQIDTN